MSATTELENLVVHLTGDGSSYMQMMRMADEATKRTADVIAVASGQIRDLGTTLQGFAQTAVNALSAFGVAASLKGAFSSFSEFETRTVRLNAIMEHNGENVEANTARYKEFAKYIDAVSSSSRGQAMQMLATARAEGLSSDMAMAAIRNAVALSGIHGGTAENYLQTTIGVAQGRYNFRGLKGYKGMDKEQQLSKFAKETDPNGIGMKLAGEVAETAAAQLTKLGQSLGEVSIEVGGLLAGAMNPFVRILRQAVELFRALDPETKKTIAVVVALTLAFLAIGPVISTVLFVLNLFHVQQIVGIAVWLSYKAVMLTVAATFGLVKLLLFTNIAGWLAYHLVMLTLAPILILVNALINGTGLSVIALNAALLVIAGGAVYVGFLAIKSAVIAISDAVTMMWGILSGSANVQTQLERVTDIFGEWWGVLKDVFKIAQYDLPAAWKLLSAGAELAVMQIQLLFPPLWAFLESGFSILAKTIGAFFQDEFGRAMYNFKAGLYQSTRIFQGELDSSKKMQIEVNAAYDKGAEIHAGRARAQMKLLAENFKLPEDTPEIIAQRKVIEGIRTEGLESAKLAKQKMDLASGIGKSIKEAFKSSKVDAVEFGSAAALTHLQDYAEKVARLRDAEGNVIGIGGPGASPSGGVVVSSSGAVDGKAIADQATEHRKEMVNRLREISANTEQLVRQGGGVVIKPAALGG